MNLTDLHYVVEIDKSGSISKAAKELYVAQPNLSKAIKHLEREFGISIFERSSKGVKATREGQKFLEYAKRIIYEIEEMKRDCSDLGKENLSFKITVPRASYISSAFAEFIGMQSKETAIKAEFQESSSMHAIENVLHNFCRWRSCKEGVKDKRRTGRWCGNPAWGLETSDRRIHRAE